MSFGTTSIPVLMYHHIAPTCGVHPERFREQLSWLRANEFHVLSGTEFERVLSGGAAPSRKSVLLTFDDGWLDNWVYALPILQEFEAPAVFFVVTSWPGQGSARSDLLAQGWNAPDHGRAMRLAADIEQRDQAVMRWEELRAAKSTGLVELQSHSHSHGTWWRGAGSAASLLTAVESDLRQSCAELQARTGSVSTQVCWPRGEFTSAMQAVARRVGFALQYSTLRGANEPGVHGARVVRRLHVENRPISWFASRMRLYSRPTTARALGWCHQGLHRLRMRRRHAKIWSEHQGLSAPWWRLV